MALQPPVAPGDETIGGRLKRLRLERGFSQRELAAPGVSYAYISRIEAGTRQPSVKALRRLAAKLGVSADYLETGAYLPPAEARELRLSELELAVRLGNGADAAGPLEALLAESLAAGDGESALRARVSLALLARARGEVQRMVMLLEDAVEGRPFDPVNRVEVYAGLGTGYAAAGRSQLAVVLYERCLAAVRELEGAQALEVRYATLLSQALGDAGDLARAREVIEDALARGEQAADPRTRVGLSWSLARRAREEGRAELALRYARRALALLDATEDSLNLARAHLLSASLTIAGQGPDDAEGHLDAAERLLAATPSLPDAAMARVKRAQLAALRADGAGAVRLARAALESLHDELAGERGAALSALADGLALQGRHEEADAAYAEAVELLEQRHQWREATQGARAWARMLRASGREAEALDVLDRAAELGLRAVPSDAHSG